MMQRLFFMMIFFLSLSLESCSKEDDNNPSNSENNGGNNNLGTELDYDTFCFIMIGMEVRLLTVNINIGPML